MRIPDAQLDLFAKRLESIGVGRRDFLKVVGAMAAFGGLGFATEARAAKPSKPGAGEKLAKEQVLRYGGGGWFQNEPSSHDFNKDLYCSGVPALFAGLMVFNADFVSVPWMATKVDGNKDGSVWTFTIRKDSRWSDNSPVSARDFEWAWKRQLDPATAAPYASFLYDLKNGEAYNKKQLTDASQVGVLAKDDWTLKVTLEGPRGYFPVLAAYLAALPAHKGSVEKHGDKWTEAGNIVSNGPFTLEAWEHNKQIVLTKNPYYYDAKTKAIQKYDKKLALEQLKGPPFEGGKNWPKITLSMRDEGLGSKPLAEAIQAVLLDSLNMKTDLEVLEPRVFRERLWKQDLQFVWIRWFMDYPDPHNEYFDTFYGKKTTGRRQAWVNEAFDKELEAGRDTRDPKKRLEAYKKAEEIMQQDVGYVPVAWVVRYAAKKPWVAGIEKNKAGEYVVDGNIYVDMFEHIYITEKG